MKNYKVNEVAFSGPAFTVERRSVVSPMDGAEFNRDVVVHAPVSIILAINENDEALVTHEYRAGTDAITFGLPAGCVDPGEDGLNAAVRELAEETGYHVPAENFVNLMTVQSSEGFLDETGYLYVAHFNTNEVEKTDVSFDHDENVVSEWVPVDQLVEMTLDGTIQSSKAVNAILGYHAQKSRDIA